MTTLTDRLADWARAQRDASACVPTGTWLSRQSHLVHAATWRD